MAGSSSDSSWVEDKFREAVKENAQDIGRINLALFGKTGVGKSTLVNAIFGDEHAKTGIGAPVTDANHLHLHVSGCLGILDTVGLEIGKDTEILLSILRREFETRRRQALSEQIHVAWYCVRFSDRRFEDVEADFIRELEELGVPVVLVLTQVPLRSGQPHPDAVELAEQIKERGLPIFEGRPFMTMAKDDQFAGFERHGLEDILDATFRAAPDGVATALNAAQRIELGRKDDEAFDVVKAAAAAAAAAGAVPIPFSDAVVLVPIQLAMMGRIAVIYGVSVDTATTAAVAATAVASQGGRIAAGGLLKMIPVVGSALGGVVNAGVASAITVAMGGAWALVCHQLAEGKFKTVEGALDSDAIREVFMDEVKRRFRKPRD